MGKSYIGGIKGEAVVDLSIEMAMLAGENYCPGRSAYRVGDTGICEQHSLFCNPVNVRSFNEFITIGADCLIGMIISHDKEDVGSLWLLFAGLFRLATPEKDEAQEDDGIESHNQYIL